MFTIDLLQDALAKVTGVRKGKRKGNEWEKRTNVDLAFPPEQPSSTQCFHARPVQPRYLLADHALFVSWYRAAEARIFIIKRLHCLA